MDRPVNTGRNQPETAGNRSSERKKAFESRFLKQMSNCKSIFRNANSGKGEASRKRLVIAQTKRHRRFSDSRQPTRRKKERFVLPETGTGSELVHCKADTPGKGKIRSAEAGHPIVTMRQRNDMTGVEQ
jgi:hypothetical protein